MKSCCCLAGLFLCTAASLAGLFCAASCKQSTNQASSSVWVSGSGRSIWTWLHSWVIKRSWFRLCYCDMSKRRWKEWKALAVFPLSGVWTGTRVCMVKAPLWGLCWLIFMRRQVNWNTGVSSGWSLACWGRRWRSSTRYGAAIDNRAAYRSCVVRCDVTSESSVLAMIMKKVLKLQF